MSQERRELVKEQGAEAAYHALLPDVLTGDLRSNKEGRMDQTSINKEFVKRHFEAVASAGGTPSSATENDRPSTSVSRKKRAPSVPPDVA
jgi:hypothetical protein